MTDENIWDYDNLEVNEEGKVEGEAITQEKDGHTVAVSVFSYEFSDSDGETLMNHVPNVVVTDADGSIIAEPYAHDSRDPEKAIQSAKSVATRAFQIVENYV